MKEKLGLFVLYYLRFFAKLQLKKNKNCKVIGITGSAGKTSTRNAIYAVLKNKYKVKVSFKANSESGISLNILGLEMQDYSAFDWLRILVMAPIRLLTYFEKFDYYVVEMGIDSPNPPKNMDFLLSIIQPKMAVFLNANINHSFAFDHLSTEKDPAKRKAELVKMIAKEKAKLVLSLDQNGLAFLNFDDQNIKKICQKITAESYSFASDNNCDLQILTHKISIDDQKISSIFKFKLQSHYGKIKEKNQEFAIEIKDFLLPKHFAYSLAAAILIGLKTGFTLEEIQRALQENFKLPAGRASVIKGKNNSLIIDSSYNASSMLDLIEMVKDLPKTKFRKIALLGDMRELGQESQSMHEAVAQLASEAFTEVYLVGPEMQNYALPILVKNGVKTETFINSKEAGEIIAKQIKENDLLFVKGSQNTIFLEKAVEQIMDNPKDAKKLLCRQSDYWLKIKS